jgi:hypothetical protein
LLDPAQETLASGSRRDQVLSPAAFPHPLRAPLRRIATAVQRDVSSEESAALPVTKDGLQSNPDEGASRLSF